ncbi:MAG: hemolysin family protein [Acidimicrobiales bacterium]
MTGGEIVATIAVVVMIALAALLAAAETAITRVSTARAEALVEEGRRGAKVLRTLIDQRERVLNPLLLVVLGCQLGAATIVAVLVDRRWGTEALVGVFAFQLLFVYVVAEAVPKSWSLAHPDRSATAIAPVARLVSSIAPLRWIANGVVRIFGASTTEDPHGDVAEEELLALAEEAAASEAIDEDERRLIEHIITFGDTVVKEVMVPRPDMVALDTDCLVRSAIEIVILNGYSRVPVYSESIDDIVGIVHSKDLLRAGQDERTGELVTSLMREPRFVPESKRIAELLREMQGEKFHMAIVIDEYGGTAGLVTLEDLIEEVVGEIVDEFDVEQPMIEQVDGVRLRVNGRVPLDDLGELLGRELPEGDWSTVGGLIFNSLGHVPAVGEICEVDGHRFLVERVQGRRIARVMVTPAPILHADEVEVS